MIPPPSGSVAQASAPESGAGGSGWGVTIAGTPYSANALLLERLTGYPARVGALRWNWPLSAAALLVAGGLGALLTLLLAPAG